MSEPIQPSSEEDDEIDPSHLPDLADLVWLDWFSVISHDLVNCARRIP